MKRTTLPTRLAVKVIPILSGFGICLAVLNAAIGNWGAALFGIFASCFGGVVFSNEIDRLYRATERNPQ